MNNNVNKHFGYIDRFFPDRGFGFIVGDDNMSYFFHYTGLKFPVEKIVVGTAVSFEVTERMVNGVAKTKAINITVSE